MGLRKKLKLATGLLLLVNLISCNALPTKKSSVDPPSTDTPNSLGSSIVEADKNWVIITKQQAEEMGIDSWLGESDDFWNPSGEDILQLEDQLGTYLIDNASQFYRQPPVWESLDAYQRQYIGLQRGEKQIIYGNYFCNNLGINWQQDLVIVEDGGECYFQVEYDVGDELFIMLLVNGES